MHYALETTHAIAICPFHSNLTIRIGDDAAESHAFARARKLVKSDGTMWEGELFGRNLDANSAKGRTVTVLTAPFWVTRSYKWLRAFGSGEYSAKQLGHRTTLPAGGLRFADTTRPRRRMRSRLPFLAHLIHADRHGPMSVYRGRPECAGRPARSRWCKSITMKE